MVRMLVTCVLFGKNLLFKIIDLNLTFWYY